MQERKVIQIFIKLFGNPPKVWVLFNRDPTEVNEDWDFVGIYATKKALLHKKKDMKKKLFWREDCFQIREEEIRFEGVGCK